MSAKYKRLTQQEIIGMYSLHHETLDPPDWSRNPDEWPVCTECAKDIYYCGDEESGILWACSDPACEMR